MTSKAAEHVTISLDNYALSFNWTAEKCSLIGLLFTVISLLAQAMNANPNDYCESLDKISSDTGKNDDYRSKINHGANI